MEIHDWINQIEVLGTDCTAETELRRIAETKNDEEAFYLCDISDIIGKYRNWKVKMPRVETFYAIKCNPSLAVIRTLSLLGTGFDCATKDEMDKALASGIHPDRIVFAHPTKPTSHIIHARAVGITKMTFDNEHELLKIKKLYPAAKMIIRIKNDSNDAIRRNPNAAFGKKFGCDHVTEAPGLLKLAKKLEIDVIGVSFHVGTLCAEEDAYRRGIVAARKVFDHAGKLGFNFSLLDIGGGFPGAIGSSIDSYANVINDALDQFFPDPSIRVIAEPGLYYVCSAFRLACNVHSKKYAIKEESSTGQKIEHVIYYMNEGIYQSLMSVVLYRRPVQPKLLKEYSGVKHYPSTIWGQTCSSLDLIKEDIILPDMELGDWMMFENRGAYTLAVSTSFNGYHSPKEFYVALEKDLLLLQESIASRRSIST